MEIIVIGDEITLTGFRMAGIKNTYSLDIPKQSFRDLLQDENIGVIIVTEKFAEQHRSLIEESRKTKKRINPIVVEIPDSQGPIKREVDPIKELIKRAIGADIG